MATKNCVFCGREGVSAEHVLPQWLRKTEGGIAAMSKPPALTPHLVQHARYQDEKMTDAVHGKTVRTLDLTVRVVCPKCNGGWMSQLESQAKPLLIAMNAGTKMELTKEETTLLARWAIKTSAMFQYSHANTRSFSNEDVVEIMSSAIPSKRYFVEVFKLATLQERMTLFQLGAMLTRPTALPPNGPEQPNSSVTMVFADRVGFTVTYSALVSPYLIKPRVAHPGVATIWPPAGGLSWPRRPLPNAVMYRMKSVRL